MHKWEVYKSADHIGLNKANKHNVQLFYYILIHGSLAAHHQQERYAPLMWIAGF